MELDDRFPSDLEISEQKLSDDLKLKDFFHSYQSRGSLEVKPTPAFLPGFYHNYWLKIQAFGLPFFRSKYPGFTSAWLTDISGNVWKEVANSDPSEIFLPSVKELKECLARSYLHLENPSCSRTELSQAFLCLLKAQLWLIEESEELSSMKKEYYRKKIDSTLSQLTEISRILRKGYRKDKAETQQKKHDINPGFRDQVETAGKNFHASEDRRIWFENMKETYKRIKSSKDFVPSDQIYSQSMNMVFTELLTCTSLRPKGLKNIRFSI